MEKEIKIKHSITVGIESKLSAFEFLRSNNAKTRKTAAKPFNILLASLFRIIECK